MNELQEDSLQRIKNLEQQIFDLEIKSYQEAVKRETEDKIIVERYDHKVADLNTLIEAKFSRKKKTKADFLLEIKNMHE